MKGGMTDACADADANLARRCLAGDASAFEQIIDRYQRLLVAVCWRMLGHRQDAEDIVQEVFLRAYRHLDRWDPTRPLRPWLVTIAVNRCRTELSRRRPDVRGEDGASLAQTVAAPASTESDLAEELQRGIDQLREEYRTVFVLFYQQELPVQEIAEVCEVPVGTVKTWLHRARHQLAELLRQRRVVTESGHELH
jgi:RNA polymerase sigma-70 factor, ECF subfamily